MIQTALTPVFLLSGIGTLLNTFNARLARVADHHQHLVELLKAEDDEAAAEALRRHIARVRRRRSALDSSVVLGGLAGALTCGAAFALFLVTLRSAVDSELLLWLFGGALVLHDRGAGSVPGGHRHWPGTASGRTGRCRGRRGHGRRGPRRERGRPDRMRCSRLRAPGENGVVAPA